MNPNHDERGRFTFAYDGESGTGGHTEPRTSPKHSDRHRAAIAAGRDPRDEHPTRPPGPTEDWTPQQARDYLRALDDAEGRRAAAGPPHRPDKPKPGPNWHDPPVPTPPPTSEAIARHREQVAAYEATRAAWGLEPDQLERRHKDGPRLLTPPGRGIGAPTLNELHNRAGQSLTHQLQRQADLRGDSFQQAGRTVPQRPWPEAPPGRPAPDPTPTKAARPDRRRR
jgi:hypothetical protein